MRAVFGVRVAVDRERTVRECARLAKRLLAATAVLQREQREVGACGGNVDVVRGVGARRFEDVQRLLEFGARLGGAVGFAQEHRIVVVQGGETAVGGREGGARGGERLLVEVFGLFHVAGGAL